ncbi:MAG TPA: hypothetical protein VFC84_02710 [Desulfosporosinus sp.]|nr:hypothetical protein [Desulfosporosinus sp.]
MSDINASDMDELAKKLEKSSAEQPDKSMNMVSFKDLFTPTFMTTYTDFADFNELLTVGKFNVTSLEEFMALLDKEFDVFINKTTKFKTWEEMQSTAVADYLKKDGC